jgi:7-cyano-7-deazaguanine reductase
MTGEPLKALGESAARNAASYQFDQPDAAMLERFQAPDSKQAIEITCPEFTCLCPVTGQPDFATIIIRYQPKEWCVESKALKLYLMGFRNFGTFHEACIARITDDLQALLDPEFLVVTGDYAPRGGVHIVPVSARGVPPM